MKGNSINLVAWVADLSIFHFSTHLWQLKSEPLGCKNEPLQCSEILFLLFAAAAAILGPPLIIFLLGITADFSLGLKPHPVLSLVNFWKYKFTCEAFLVNGIFPITIKSNFRIRVFRPFAIICLLTSLSFPLH